VVVDYPILDNHSSVIKCFRLKGFSGLTPVRFPSSVHLLTKFTSRGMTLNLFELCGPCEFQGVWNEVYQTLGCNNGGGGGILLQLFTNCFSQCFLVFSPSIAGMWKRRKFLPELILPIKPRMHICPCLWNVGISNKIWIQNYFGPVTVDSEEVFRLFACWRHGSRLATCFIAPKNCIFWGESFEPIKTWQLWILESYKVFIKPPYTIVTPYQTLGKLMDIG